MRNPADAAGMVRAAEPPQKEEIYEKNMRYR
jgi:hypothetical protein